MKPALRARLRTDFYSFVRVAFHTLTGRKLGHDRYLEHLCHEVGRFAKGETSRLLINLPPRHLKTLAASICGTAWILGNSPSTRVMVVSNGEQLSKDIAHQIRKLMRSDRYKAIFEVRLEKGKEAVMHFGTTAGGAVYSAPIGGALTGFGGDFIIVDDLHHINDAGNLEKMAADIEIIDTVVETRFDNPKRGGMMVIGHRIAPGDLSGCLLEQGGWHHVVLPLIAPRDCRYVTGGERWLRRKGELLRPDAWDEAKVAARQARSRLPDFETLYQQNPFGGFRRIKRKYFQSFSLPSVPASPIVLSIDPGQSGGRDNSFSVIQAWYRDGKRHFLIDQWRQQCPYRELKSACKLFIRKYRPSVVIIEMTGQGPALSSEISLEKWMRLEKVIPSATKIERLAKHCRLIKKGRVALPDKKEWRGEYIEEFTHFPKGKFTDQVDATTQYFDCMRDHPHLPIPPARGIAARASSSSPFATSWPSLQNSSAVNDAMKGIAVRPTGWR